MENAYFSSNPPPKALPQHVAAAEEFINQHAAANRRVVLVTSGGTTVPLEKQTVRFIDNFSAGTRGATSAEYFLESGYAVIFLHRQFSLLPYSRHYSHSTDCFLDFLREGEDGNVVANPAYQQKMLRVLRKYNAAKRQNMLLMLPFTTITDYLHELRAVAQLMRPLGPNGLLYLAAAVSDFFVPPERMAEHKIQSTDATDSLKSKQQGPTTITTEKRGNEEEEAFDNFDSSPAVPRSKRLIVDLDPVPKFLKNLVDGWAPEGMIVSFKLETDPALLVHKAKYSLDRYQHHLVIGNLLTTRKWEVVFVSPGREDQWIRVPISRRKKTLSGSGVEDLIGVAEREGGGSGTVLEQNISNEPMDPATLPEGEPEMEIESLIIPAVEALHTKHVESVAARNAGGTKSVT
jgi:phosphopantothenate-cysteine ligase